MNASERTAPYLDLLDRVLDDLRVTAPEAEVLRATAERWGGSREDVVAAHHGYLESLVAAAVQDGRVTVSERAELEAVTRLLAIDPSILEALLVRGMEDRG